MRAKTVVLLIIFIGLMLYSNTLLNNFVGDDFPQILNNTNVHSILNIPYLFASSTYENGGSSFVYGIFYRPLMLAFYSIFYAISGQDPFTFHLFQILLHITNSILLYFFIRGFLKSTPAFIISLFFLVHPINNEAVVYSANLQETIFFFFGITTLLIIKTSSNNLKSNFLISVLMLMSLLAKESALLFIFLSIAYCWLFKPEKLKLIFVSNSISIIIYLILRYPIAHMNEALGSIAPISKATLMERILHIPVIITYYIKSFFFPLDLSGNQFWIIKTLSWSNFYLPLLISILIFISVLIGGLLFYQKYKKLFKIYLFFSIWFLIGLGLHLQIIPLDATVADRWFYFPIVGLLGIIALLIQQLKIKSIIIRKVGFVVLIIIIILFSIRTFQRNFEWKDDLTLMSHDINVTPKNFILDNLYASALITDGQTKKAKPYVESSIKEYPFYANLNNMAIIYTTEGNLKEAKKYLKKAVNESRFYVVYENYANFLFIYDDLREAEIFSKEALNMFPKNPRLWMTLAKIQYINGYKKEAIKSAETGYNLLQNKLNKETLESIKNNKFEDPRAYRILE